MKWISAFVLFLLAAWSKGQVEQNCEYVDVDASFSCNYLNAGSGDFVKQSLQDDVPSGTSLQVSFSYSDISGLPSDLFAGYSVSTFYCTSCNATSLPVDSMASFGGTTELHFYSSTIGTVSGTGTDSLPFLDTLQLFIIELSYVDTIESNAFSSFSALVGIVIDSGAAEHSLVLQDYAFADIPQVQDIVLGQNGINSIPANTFRSLPALTGLILADNNIQTLQQDTFTVQDMPLVTQMALENPWYCNCTLQWLKDYINDNQITTDPLTCTTPAGDFNDIDFCGW